MKEKSIDIISIGSELVSGHCQDTNTPFFIDALNKVGVSVRSVSIVRDVEDEIVATIQEKAQTATCIIVTGGLGPTPDDITREAIAKACGVSLAYREWEAVKIRKKLVGRPKALVRLSEREACLPVGAHPLKNAVGVAPGFRIALGKCTIFCVPGVPQEASTMFSASIVPFLSRISKGQERCVFTIKTIGLGESRVFIRIRPFLNRAISIGLYPQGFEVEVRVSAPLAKKKALQKMHAVMCKALDGHVYATTDITIEEAIQKLLKQQKKTIACAESCTGGLVGKRLTELPGSSQVFKGGVIVYDNEVKKSQLGVTADQLKKWGAVSSPVVRTMAKQIAENFNTSLGVSVSGIAGPSGGTKAKPVGTIFIGVSTKKRTLTKKYMFKGPRDKIRWLSSQAALFEVWQILQ